MALEAFSTFPSRFMMNYCENVETLRSHVRTAEPKLLYFFFFLKQFVMTLCVHYVKIPWLACHTFLSILKSFCCFFHIVWGVSLSFVQSSIARLRCSTLIAVKLAADLYRLIFTSFPKTAVCEWYASSFPLKVTQFVMSWTTMYPGCCKCWACPLWTECE